jgi:hypothetical protein
VGILAGHLRPAERNSPCPLPASALAPPRLLPSPLLDFGLRIRLEAQPSQRTIFSGAENLSVQELIAELSEMVSSLRVHSFALRAQLERVTSALMVNVECGFWPLAGRAALDLGGLLASAGRRGLADRELCVRGSRCAFRIADLLEKEVR